MSYGYSDFSHFSLDIYSGSCKDVQLPPLKKPFLSDEENKTGIYIHTLNDSNVYSALSLPEDISQESLPIIKNGWIYAYDISENDFLRLALDKIKDEPAVPVLNLNNGITRVFTTLQNQQINLPAIFKFNFTEFGCHQTFREIPWIHGQAIVGRSKPVCMSSALNHQELLNKQIIPGLIFEFDRNDKFIAIISQPVEETQNNIRKAYIEDLLLLMSTKSTDFSNFKQVINEYSEKFSYSPCVIRYDNIVDIRKYIHNVKTIACTNGQHPTTDKNKDKLLIKYLDSPWSTFALYTAVGALPQFFNVDQLTVDYSPRDPKYRLPTIFVTTVADAFRHSLELYNSLLKSDDKVLVVPYELFQDFKDNIISLWLETTSLK